MQHTAPVRAAVQMREIPVRHPIMLPTAVGCASPVQNMPPTFDPQGAVPPEPDPLPGPIPAKLEAEPADEDGNLDTIEVAAAMKLQRVAEESGDWDETELYRIWLRHSDGSRERVGVAQCHVQSFEERGDPRSCRAIFWTFDAIACGLATVPQLPATQAAWVIVCLSLTAAGNYDIDRICPAGPPSMLKRPPEQQSSCLPFCPQPSAAGNESSWSSEIVRLLYPTLSEIFDGNREGIVNGLGGGVPTGRAASGGDDDRREISGGGCAPSCGGFTGGFGGGGGLFGF
jgi:hypothetical protein